MGMTVVMVLHDLNQASTYSDHIVVVQAGEKAMYGTPNEVMTTDMIRNVYRMASEVQYVQAEKKPRIHLLSTVR